MAIIALKAWYLEQYEPARELEKRPQDLRLSRNSLLKAGMRADFLDDSEEVKKSTWFQRYLSGEAVEFYIEGSGTYTISNIDLLSHEMYFAKQDSIVQLEPFIFFCYQTDYDESSALIREGLGTLLEKLNRKSRLPLSLEESNRGGEGALRRNSPLMRKLRNSLLFIADGTSVAQSSGSSPQLLPSANVCVELGYALQCKRPEQIILARQERDDLPGHFPFEIPSEQQIIFHNSSDLSAQLKSKIEGELKRYGLV